MSASDLPLFPAAMVGWRSWSVVDGRICSLNSNKKWPVGKELVAHCSHGRSHRVPAQYCQCGIYSLKSKKLLLRSPYFGYECYGQVSLWGRILEGEDGYRAELAYPKAIYLSYMNYRLVEPLSVYGVPVRVMNPYSKKVEYEHR